MTLRLLASLADGVAGVLPHEVLLYLNTGFANPLVALRTLIVCCFRLSNAVNVNRDYPSDVADEVDNDNPGDDDSDDINGIGLLQSAVSVWECFWNFLLDQPL